jgi:hypothetical protein
MRHPPPPRPSDILSKHRQEASVQQVPGGAGEGHPATSTDEALVLHSMLKYLVAASAAGGVPFCDQQRSLTVGSHLGRRCHSCCERTCLRVTIPPLKSVHQVLSVEPVLPTRCSTACYTMPTKPTVGRLLHSLAQA